MPITGYNTRVGRTDRQTLADKYRAYA